MSPSKEFRLLVKSEGIDRGAANHVPTVLNRFKVVRLRKYQWPAAPLRGACLDSDKRQSSPTGGFPFNTLEFPDIPANEIETCYIPVGLWRET